MIKIKKKKYISIFAIVVIAVICIFVFLQQRQRINIILIAIDALRPDHLGCYGYKRDTSPNIDRLAKEGTRFTQVITAGGWTVESVPSILTGAYSLTHQIRDHHILRNPYVKTLAWELARKGYECVLWSNHNSIQHLDIRDGFREFHTLVEYKDEKPIINDHLLTNKIQTWLKEKDKNSPFFLYIHYEGAHIPYRPPEPYKSMYLHDKFRGDPEFIPIFSSQSGEDKYCGVGVIPYVAAEDNINDINYYISQYDGAISYTDAQIGRLIVNLKKLDLDKNTLIILTADHGEYLGEHNIYFNHMGAYEENIRVPLMIKFPKMFPKGKVISRQVSLIDIAPTILEVAGVDKPSYMQGESLLAFVKPFRIYYGEYVFSCYKKIVTLRTKNWKLIYNPPHRWRVWELYNLKQDPKEQHNLVAKRPHEFRKLKQVLENWQQRITCPIPAKQGPPLTEKDKQRLRSLGYAQ